MLGIVDNVGVSEGTEVGSADNVTIPVGTADGVSVGETDSVANVDGETDGAARVGDIEGLKDDKGDVVGGTEGKAVELSLGGVALGEAVDSGSSTSTGQSVTLPSKDVAFSNIPDTSVPGETFQSLIPPPNAVAS